MDAAKRKRLEKKGWKLGDAKDFLGLSDAESQLVEVKVRLVKALQDLREKKGVTQAELARRIDSSQPRVAHMLAGRDVSVDQLMKSLFALGASQQAVARALTPKATSRRRSAHRRAG